MSALVIMLQLKNGLHTEHTDAPSWHGELRRRSEDWSGQFLYGHSVEIGLESPPCIQSPCTFQDACSTSVGPKDRVPDCHKNERLFDRDCFSIPQTVEKPKSHCRPGKRQREDLRHLHVCWVRFGEYAWAKARPLKSSQTLCREPRSCC